MLKKYVFLDNFVKAEENFQGTISPLQDDLDEAAWAITKTNTSTQKDIEGHSSMCSLKPTFFDKIGGTTRCTELGGMYQHIDHQND